MRELTFYAGVLFATFICLFFTLIFDVGLFFLCARVQETNYFFRPYALQGYLHLKAVQPVCGYSTLSASIRGFF